MDNTARILRPDNWLLFFGGRGVDNRSHLGNACDGEIAFLGVLANQLLIWRDVDAVNLVIRHITVQPLDLWTQLTQNTARFLGDRLKLIFRQLSGSRQVTLDDILWHKELLYSRVYMLGNWKLQSVRPWMIHFCQYSRLHLGAKR